MSTPVQIGGDDDGSLWAQPVDQAMIESISDTPSGGKTQTRNEDQIGPIRRASASTGLWSSIDYKSFALDRAELATVIKTFREEMYRNQFPVFVKRWENRCERCGLTYDLEMDECECGHRSFETPDLEERSRLEDLTAQVNENQSLRQLFSDEEQTQAFYGVSVLIIRKSYDLIEEIVDGQRIKTYRFEGIEDVDEILHGNPMRIVPITDERGQHGGWWTCPSHRESYWEEDELTFSDGRCMSTCPSCDGRLEEVGYVERSSSRSDGFSDLYLKEEIVDWSRYFPNEEIQGLDGRSPIMPLIKLQALLSFDREYDISFLDPDNEERLPNKMLLAYGESIGESLSSSMNEQEDKGPWEQGLLAYEGDPEDVEIDILDLTPQQTLSGRQQTMKKMESKIRSMFGITDAMDNELSDTGSFNATGMQVEIENRRVASAQKETKDRALNRLCDQIGITDWKIDYVNPQRERHTLNVQQRVQTAEQARRADIPYQVEDSQIILKDHEFDPTEDKASEQ